MINEFLADPEGSDSGHEFVEFLNTGSETMDLGEVEFQFANGAVGPSWETRWRGSAGLVLPAGERFLLVDRNWQGTSEFQGQAGLALQNGPDAVRLVHGDQVLDLVGYGALTDVEMMEGRAVPLPVGLSLSRRPDGRDTDDNFADFVPSEPTPGQLNFADHEVRLLSSHLEPPCLPSGGGHLVLRARLANTGLLPVPTAMARVLLQQDDLPGQWVLDTLLAGFPAGQEQEIQLGLDLVRAGTFRILLEMNLDSGDGPQTLVLARVQVGPGDLLLSEIMAAPGRGQGEWIELQAGPRPVNLGSFVFRDEESDWRPLPRVALEPGQWVVVAQDSAALLTWEQDNLDHGLVPLCGESSLGQTLRQAEGSWPTLNNNPPAGRPYADRIYLADSLSLVIDHATWPGTSALPSPQGVSWARSGPIWRPSTAAAGSTPGCPNSVAVQEVSESDLDMWPPVLEPSAGVTTGHIRFDLGPDSRPWHLRIYNLWGVMVRDLGGGIGEQATELIWDGKDEGLVPVTPGGYVVLLSTGQEGGSLTPRGKILVVVR